VLLLAHVARDGHRLPAGLLDPAGGLVGLLLLAVQVGEQYVRPFAGERQGHRPADAGVPTGDHGLAVGEPPAAAVGVLAVVRGRVHRPGPARVRLVLGGKVGGRMLVGGMLLIAHSAAPSPWGRSLGSVGVGGRSIRRPRARLRPAGRSGGSCRPPNRLIRPPRSRPPGRYRRGGWRRRSPWPPRPAPPRW